MFVFSNKDKLWQQREKDENDGFRRGCRMIVCGTPNSGKSCLVKNLVCNTDPPFDKVYICKMPQSREYDSIDHIHLDKVSDLTPEMVVEEEKALLLIEDFSKRTIKDKADEKRLLDILGYDCSHGGLSLCICAQNMFEISVELRRRSDCFAIFPAGCDLDWVLKRLFISDKDKKKIYQQLDREEPLQHDVFVIDAARPPGKRVKFNNQLLP